MRSDRDKSRGLRKWAVGTGAWILAGVLIVTIALIFTAREDRQGFPSMTNTRGSGYAAFAELLRRDGYEVRLERSVRPKYAKGDLVIAVTRPIEAPEAIVEFEEAIQEETLVDNHGEAVLAHLESGGRVLEVLNDSAFEHESDLVKEATRTVTSASAPDKAYTLSIPGGEWEDTTFGAGEAGYTSWYAGDSPFVDYRRVGDGLLATVSEGLPITNRYLDKDDNAEFYLQLVRGLAPSGSTVVFDEAGIGNAETPTVANTLGGWAVAVRWQALVLFAVMIYTYARRFGLPETERRTVRGSRELFDAIADVLRRTRNTGLALDNLLIECDERIRRVLGAPGSMRRADLLQHVPVALREQYLHVAEHANANTPPRQAAGVAAKLVRLLEDFERDSREARGLKR